ncbi:MAG: PDZ domain-containing protein, partial [Planctomycetia bacterium]|nr:PDZ domain-containing protein [Planctomycetia bacterium]
QGRWIAFISDMDGEDQIYLIDQSGKGKPIRITSTFKNKLDDLRWSPCGKSLSVWDAKERLYVVDLDMTKPDQPKAKKVTTIARELYDGPKHTAWSPSGEYLAFVLNVQTGGSVIYIWSRETGKMIQATDPAFDCFSPAFAPNGDWLYYIAQREFYPQISTSMEWNFTCNRFCGLFAVPLRKDVKNIFLAKSDEVEIKDDAAKETKETKDGKDTKDESKSKSDAKTAKKADASKPDKTKSDDDKSDKKADKPKSEKIEFAGIANRAVRIPVSSENYTSLAAAGDFLYYIKSGAPYYGRESSVKPTLMSFDLKQLKEAVCSSETPVFLVSPDGTKLMVRQGRNFKIASVGATVPPDAKPVSTSGLFVDRIPSQEWNEVFNEVWRRFRDFFYVENMHGCDWNAIGKQYRSLLPYVAHRDDLTYILTEMISELNVGHTYVAGGDAVQPERAPVALPGATFVLDKKADRYRIDHIYAGQNEEPKYRSPLTEFGVNVSEGEYVFEIDGVELTGSDNPYRLLRNKQNPVTWKVGKKADGSDARTIQYNPVASEANLRYLDFVLDRRKETERLSGGKVGYLHIPNMGAEGAYEFIKWYYPQLRKSAIIIDVRSNGGGNISAWLIERLNLKLLGTRFGSTSQAPSTYPITACNAHLAC